jgi:hypothetical protein
LAQEKDNSTEAVPFSLGAGQKGQFVDPEATFDAENFDRSWSENTHKHVEVESAMVGWEILKNNSPDKSATWVKITQEGYPYRASLVRSVILRLDTESLKKLGKYPIDEKLLERGNEAQVESDFHALHPIVSMASDIATWVMHRPHYASSWPFYEAADAREANKKIDEEEERTHARAYATIGDHRERRDQFMHPAYNSLETALRDRGAVYSDYVDEHGQIIPAVRTYFLQLDGKEASRQYYHNDRPVDPPDSEVPQSNNKDVRGTDPPKDTAPYKTKAINSWLPGVSSKPAFNSTADTSLTATDSPQPGNQVPPNLGPGVRQPKQSV